jgi:putative hydrolase of the HAD superfamily
MIDVIAFDADDTLWYGEMFYRETEQKFLGLMEKYGKSAEEVLTELHRIEIENLPPFGYGIRGFILSVIETAVLVTGGEVRGEDIQRIVDFGREMTEHEIRLMDGARETLEKMNGRRLMLITKGDALDQEKKLERSGLSKYFPSVEVVVDKNRGVYEKLLSRHAIDPGRFLMIGNSLRSDITPVLALGGYAVHVPYADDWAHESDADLPEDRSRFYEISSLRQLPELIEKIESAA